MKSVERRLRALECVMEPPEPQGEHARELSRGNRLHIALHIAFVLRQGGEARKELDTAGASLDPESRAEFTEHIKAAETLAKALEGLLPTALIQRLSEPVFKNTSPSARHLIPERLGGRHEVR